MEVVNRRCAGLDVHKKSVTACVLTPGGKELRTFGATTGELLALAGWLVELNVTHVAMESAGVYWKPVFNLLEGFEMELLLVNARHMKAVPGRKTDVKDAEWIADLLRHGLLRGSFVPEKPQRELRELTRYRRRVIQQRSQVVSRVQKVLEGANIKLSSVATDVMGASGRAMLEAIAAGESDPKKLASLAKGVLKKKSAELEQALTGITGEHQRFLLASLLRQVAFLEQEIETLGQEISKRLDPFANLIVSLDTIPGVGVQAAEEILAEIGTDMSRFPTSKHLASWARVCPGNNESGGKRMSGSAGKGNNWLRGMLIQCAHAAGRTKNTYLNSQYHRIAARRGKKRAALAVAHTILVIIYHLIRDNTIYQDLEPNHFDQRQQQATIKRAVRRIEQLGYRVTVEAA